VKFRSAFAYEVPRTVYKTVSREDFDLLLPMKYLLKELFTTDIMNLVLRFYSKAIYVNEDQFLLLLKEI
jgi:hypothetical protein